MTAHSFIYEPAQQRASVSPITPRPLTHSHLRLITGYGEDAAFIEARLLDTLPLSSPPSDWELLR